MSLSPGWPMPKRSRQKSLLPRWAATSFNPLCPPTPPPTFILPHREEIEFVVRDQDFRRRNLEKPCQGAHGFPGKVHECGWHQQPGAGRFVAPGDTVVLRLFSERDALDVRKPFDQPVAR